MSEDWKVESAYLNCQSRPTNVKILFFILYLGRDNNNILKCESYSIENNIIWCTVLSSIGSGLNIQIRFNIYFVELESRIQTKLLQFWLLASMVIKTYACSVKLKIK